MRPTARDVQDASAWGTTDRRSIPHVGPRNRSYETFSDPGDDA